MAVVWHKRAALSRFVDMNTNCFHWSLQRLFWEPQPYISTDFLSPRDTGAHLLKLDIIWIAKVHWTQNTFNEPDFFVMSVWSLTHMNIKYVTVCTTQQARDHMSWWEILNVFWDVLLHVFKLLSAETWTCPDLLFHEVAWSQSETHGSSQQQWLYDWHWSTEYSEHTVQAHPHNQHFAHSEIHTIALTLHSEWQ